MPYTGKLLSEGAVAPAFAGQAVVEGMFKDITLSEYAVSLCACECTYQADRCVCIAQDKWVALVFYTGDYITPAEELTSLNDYAPELAKDNIHLVLTSVNSHFVHLSMTNTPRPKGGFGDMQVPLLADLNMKIAKDYGVLDEAAGNAIP